jgi:hypothetical protein
MDGESTDSEGDNHCAAGDNANVGPEDAPSLNDEILDELVGGLAGRSVWQVLPVVLNCVLQMDCAATTRPWGHHYKQVYSLNSFYYQRVHWILFYHSYGQLF